MQAETIQETENWIALNKPAGLLSIPDRKGIEISLKRLLQEKYGEIFTVHRLDRDTSGIILFAKNAEAHKYLSQQFEERTIEKIYLGLVMGQLDEKKGTIDEPIAEHPSKKGMMRIVRNGKPSSTAFDVKEEFGKYSLVEFNIHTGRTHQIRVHMQHLGHPIVCDEMYGDGRPFLISSIKRNFKLAQDQEEERPILKRLALHAVKLNFTGPEDKSYQLEVPLPKDMSALLKQLRKWKKG